MNKDVRASLRALREKLQRSDADDPVQQQRIRELQNDIDKILSEPEQEEAHEGLREHLEDFQNRFEASHPDLTLYVNHLLNTLSNLGF